MTWARVFFFFAVVCFVIALAYAFFQSAGGQHRWELWATGGFLSLALGHLVGDIRVALPPRQ